MQSNTVLRYRLVQYRRHVMVMQRYDWETRKQPVCLKLAVLTVNLRFRSVSARKYTCANLAIVESCMIWNDTLTRQETSSYARTVMSLRYRRAKHVWYSGVVQMKKCSTQHESTFWRSVRRTPYLASDMFWMFRSSGSILSQSGSGGLTTISERNAWYTVCSNHTICICMV